MAACKAASSSLGRTAGESVNARGRSPSADAFHASPCSLEADEAARAASATLASISSAGTRATDSRLVFATLQDGLRHIIAPSSSALGGVAGRICTRCLAATWGSLSRIAARDGAGA